MEESAENFPFVGSPVDATFHLTQRGKPMLVDPFNYSYNKDKEFNGKTFWLFLFHG